MMKAIQSIMILFLLIIFGVGESLAISFKEGNYEITNWMEIPAKGRIKEEKKNQCLTENDLGWKMYREAPCKLLSESNSGNTLNWEFKCGDSSIDGISGSITYYEDSFDGTLIYRNSNGSNLTVGIRGERTGDCQRTK